jgi:hypothetical protein
MLPLQTWLPLISFLALPSLFSEIGKLKKTGSFLKNRRRWLENAANHEWARSQDEIWAHWSVLIRDLQRFPATDDGFLESFLSFWICQFLKKAIFKKSGSVLLGCLIDELGEQSCFTKPSSLREPGIFGECHALYTAIEAQARRTLHAHVKLHTVLAPRLLDSISHNSSFRTLLSQVFDSMFSASLSSEIHLRDIAKTVDDLFRKNQIYASQTTPSSDAQMPRETAVTNHVLLVQRTWHAWWRLHAYLCQDSDRSNAHTGRGAA